MLETIEIYHFPENRKDRKDWGQSKCNYKTSLYAEGKPKEQPDKKG